MTCACPPAGPYSEMTCCRWDAEERCHPSRCEHPEPTARELFEQYCETVGLLANAARRYQDAQRQASEAQTQVHVLSIEAERLWAEARAAVAREVGGAVVAAGTEGAGERVLASPVGIPEAVAVETPDLG